MIPRYALPEMESIFADESRFGRWVEIELLATEAHSVLGTVPAVDAAACRAAAPKWMQNLLKTCYNASK